MIGPLFQVFGKYQSMRGGLGAMPVWGRWLLLIAAVPGIALAGLSILALGVSILALLVLTVPVYRFVRWVSGGSQRNVSGGYADSEPGLPMPAAPVDMTEVLQSMLTPGLEPKRRRHVDVTIIEDNDPRT